MVNNKLKIFKIFRNLLVFWCLFIGIGAFYGGICFLIKPDGSLLQMKEMLPYFQVLPFSEYLFRSYVFSGIALIIVNGVSNVVASVLIIKNKKIGIILGTIFGVTLILWIIIQFIIFPFNVLSTAYFVFGVLQFITGYICYVFKNQSEFTFNEADYKNIGTNKKELVVFYSREGYTKKIAYEKAMELGADVLEIKALEKTSGFLGFMWCGRFGMHRWGMKISYNNINIEEYENVTICSPIWVFSISSPMREFLKENSQKIKNINYVFVHFMKAKFEDVAKKLDKTFNLKSNSLENICCRFGKFDKK